MNFHQYLTI